MFMKKYALSAIFITTILGVSTEMHAQGSGKKKEENKSTN